MRDPILYDHFSKSPYFLPAQMKCQEDAKGKIHLLVLRKFHYKKQSEDETTNACYKNVASSNTVKWIVFM